jgi:hypothetical protein
MKNRPARLLAAVLALAASFAAPSSAIAQTSKPVAYIYVSSNLSVSNNHVVGYAASADGKLTEIPGSPWADNLSYLATNGTYLFGSTNIPTDDGKNIFSYSVGSNGALKYIGATNIQNTGSDNACNQADNLMLDHTGSYLYVQVYEAICDTQWAFQSFAVNPKTGLLDYLGLTSASAFTLGGTLTMLANNNYAYTAGGEDAVITCYQKASNGNLVNIGGEQCPATYPKGFTDGQPSGSDGYLQFIAADPTNHLAMGIYYEGSDGYIDTKIATLAANTANGSVSTSSTYATMPSTDTPLSSLVMAPGGKLLAVGGSSGIQIFNFNPSGQATVSTGLISTADVTALYWDTSNHLYAISNADNTLHVFTVTATSAEEAPGSPYIIPHPVALTGHSL